MGMAVHTTSLPSKQVEAHWLGACGQAEFCFSGPALGMDRRPIVPLYSCEIYRGGHRWEEPMATMQLTEMWAGDAP